MVGPKTVIILAVCLVLASCTAEAYDSDKLYQYHFSGSVSSSIASDPTDQSAGIVIESPLLVKKSSDGELTIKLDEPKLASFNAREGGSSIKGSDFKPMDPSGSLGKPFRIYFDGQSGSVKSMDTFAEEPAWVTNFKRGLLSFFQLKFEAQQQERGQFFTTPEKSVFGECETEYVILGPGGDQTTFNVTKSRNMAKCKGRFMHRFMPISACECVENEKDSLQYKRSSSVFDFGLIGTRENYVIDQAKLNEVFVYSPFGQKSMTLQVDTIFSLKLKSTDSSGTLSADSSALKTDSLAYEPPEVANFYASVNLEQEHHLANFYRVSATSEQAQAAIDALVQEHRNYMNTLEESNESSSYLEKPKLARLFRRATELVGTLNLQKIEQLYSKMEELGDSHKRLFWDIMSGVGTNPSFVFMKRLITEGDAPSVKIKEYLTRLSFHIKSPSKSLFDEYVNLCGSDKIQSNRDYKTICLLPLASLIHQHCAKPHAKFMRIHSEGGNATTFKKGQNTCQIATADEYFTRLVQTFSSPSSGSSSGSASAGSDELSIGEKMFSIKMAGELGVKPTVDFLTGIVRNQNEHPTLRASAMWNLIKATHIYPSLVKRFVIPYFFDRNEQLEVRIAALYNWIRAGQSLYELETMARQLETEPNRQLVVYIHSLLKSLSGLDWWPCGNSGERMARLVLPAVERAMEKHDPAAFGDSHVSISSNHLADYGYGTSRLYSAIYGEGLAPSNIYFATGEVMVGGLKLNPTTISIQAHGLDKIIKRVIGREGLFANKESWLDVFSLKRRSRRQIQSSEQVRQEAQMVGRELSDVYITATVSLHGRPIMLVEKDSKDLKKMLSDDGTIKIPHIKKLLHSFNNHTSQSMMIAFEKLDVFNNELGLPLYQMLTDFQFSAFRLNSVKFDVEPGFFKEERQGKPPTKITATLDAKSRKHNEFIGSTGLMMIGSKQLLGAGLHKTSITSVPIKMSLEANLANQRVTVKRQPIHENLMYVQHVPNTHIYNYDPSEVISIDARSLYHFNETSQMEPFKFEYMTPLAVGLKVEGKRRSDVDISLASIRRRVADSTTAMFLMNYAPSGAPLELTVSTATTEENPTRELTTVISWNHYHGTDPTGDDKDLEKFIASRTESDKKPVTVHYEVALLGGSTKERKVSLNIGYSRSHDRSLRKWRVFYNRTPLNQSDDPNTSNSEATNLCWIGQLQFPRYDMDKWLKFALLEMDHSANFSSDLTFGDQCGIESIRKADAAGLARVSMETQLSWSPEHRSVVESVLSDSPTSNVTSTKRYKRLASLHMKCIEQRKSGKALNDKTCLRFLSQAGEMSHVKANFGYQQVSAHWTKIMSKAASLYTLARSNYIDSYDDDQADRQNVLEPNMIKRASLEANLTNKFGERKLSYEISAPSYHVSYKGIPFDLPLISTFPSAGQHSVNSSYASFLLQARPQ